MSSGGIIFQRIFCMDRSVSIVKVDTRPYRTIARENWGLTSEQMKGKHVHHRIRQSHGGTNDPSNLYVCSPWFHSNVWHDGTGVCERDEQKMSEDGRKGGTRTAELRVGVCGRTPEQMTQDGQKGAKKIMDFGLGIHDPNYVASSKKSEDCRKGGKRGGKVIVESGLAIHDPLYINSEKGREDKKKGASKMNSQVWESTVDGFKGRACSVALHNKANGWDPAAKVKVG
jgi:hypothetical protein